MPASVFNESISSDNRCSILFFSKASSANSVDSFFIFRVKHCFSFCRPIFLISNRCAQAISVEVADAEFSTDRFSGDRFSLYSQCCSDVAFSFYLNSALNVQRICIRSNYIFLSDVNKKRIVLDKFLPRKLTCTLLFA